MNWARDLCQLYDDNYGKDPSLSPICHMPAKAHAELILSEDGKLLSAHLVDKEDMDIIIPVTEQSGARTSGIAPHPFTDKLIYLAGDFSEFTMQKKNRDCSAYFNAYISELKNWMESSDSHPAVNALYQYLSKETLVKDLCSQGILTTTKILDGQKEHLVLDDHAKIKAISQTEIFFRVRIKYADPEKEECTWLDQTLRTCHIKRILNGNIQKNLCYLTGKETACTYIHPKGITRINNQAKLISANDADGFTFRGRFAGKEEAISIGYESSQKIHNVLKWLIAKSSIEIDTTYIIIWDSELKSIPTLFAGESYNIEENSEDMETDDANGTEILQWYRSALKKLLSAPIPESELEYLAYPDGTVNILILDAISPGRLSMLCYDKLSLSDYLHNLLKWHMDTMYSPHHFERSSESRSVSINDIIDCGYGKEKMSANDIKLKKELAMRLYPCILYDRDIPQDIIWSLVAKATKATAYKNQFVWNHVIDVTCAVLCRENKRKKKGDRDVEENRDYLYGRLLAIADVAERVTYRAADRIERLTNARRYFERFANYPYDTWGIIYKRLMPYLDKMPPKQRTFYENQFAEVLDRFSITEYRDNSRLSPDYLLGYHHQLKELAKIGKSTNENEEE